MNDLLLAYLGNAALATRGLEGDRCEDGLRRWASDFVHEDSGVRDAILARLAIDGHGKILEGELASLITHHDPSLRAWAARAVSMLDAH